jgi:hypothetical protein
MNISEDSIFLSDQDYEIKNYKNYGVSALNKELIDYKIQSFTQVPLDRLKEENPKLIVNLTSFPQRIHEVHYTIFSLITQSFPADNLFLWLSYEEFPGGVNDLPKNLIKMLDYGLSIRWCNNIRPYNKLIYALLEDPFSIHVTADDDVYYNNFWLKELYQEYIHYGDNFIYAHRVHSIKLSDNGIEEYNTWQREIKTQDASFTYFPTGVGGVLYPPNSLNEKVINIELLKQLSPDNDDIWFWAMALLNNTKIRITKNYHKLVYVNPERELRLSDEFTLSRKNVISGGNDIQLDNVLRHFPQIAEKLI